MVSSTFVWTPESEYSITCSFRGIRISSLGHLWLYLWERGTDCRHGWCEADDRSPSQQCFQFTFSSLPVHRYIWRFEQQYAVNDYIFIMNDLPTRMSVVKPSCPKDWERRCDVFYQLYMIGKQFTSIGHVWDEFIAQVPRDVSSERPGPALAPYHADENNNFLTLAATGNTSVESQSGGLIKMSKTTR